MDHSISMDELPRYSPWPARLLGVEEWQVRSKTRNAVLREFDLERWAEVRSWLAKYPSSTVQDVDRMIMLGKKLPIFRDGSFFLVDWSDAHSLQLELYSATLKPFLTDSQTQLVEFGAGYGAIILNLARNPMFRKRPLVAGEFAQSGIEALKALARNDQLTIQVGHCDLSMGRTEGISIKEGAVVFTALAVTYVPELEERFIDFFLECRPSRVVHFEPCFEHHNSQSLFGMLCRRYIEVNDYNRNLVGILKRAEAAGRIRIVEERASVLGINPFLPISVMAWEPR